MVREASESNGVNYRFNEQADRRNATVVDKKFKAIFYASDCLIANGHEICEVQVALLQSQI